MQPDYNEYYVCAANHAMTVDLNAVKLSDKTEVLRTEPNIHDHAIGGTHSRNTGTRSNFFGMLSKLYMINKT